MKKTTVSMMAVCLLSGAQAIADAPQGYYDSLSGKSGETLKQAAKKVAASLTTVSYGEDTWEAFRTTDIRDIDGLKAWYDMYSNILVYEASGYNGLNIEHSVPNSWWGGVKNDAYRDLYHLNPSNSDANNRKSNHPLGIVGQASWTNGVTKIGTPSGEAGGAKTVFEPADQFKGDFARAYFYVFTIYDDIDWKSESDYMYDMQSYPTLKPWACDMLLEWAANDPVDAREMARNDAVASIQGNRNPFIDIPELASYIWGDDSSTPINLTGLVNPAPVNRPSAPVFDSFIMSALDTYTGRWWEPLTITISAQDGSVLFYSTDGKTWEPYPAAGIEVEGAEAGDDAVTLFARASWEKDGMTLVSPVATLNLMAKDPEDNDFTEMGWEHVDDVTDLSADDHYIIVAAKTGRVMYKTHAVTSSSKYMTCSDTPLDLEATIIEGIPTETGIVSLVDAGEGRWILSISDTRGVYQGCWTTTAARSMTLTDEGTPATINFDAEGNAVISFGEAGTLQYNASSPRFLNYTSPQQGVRLYRATEATDPGTIVPVFNQTSGVLVDGHDIILTQGGAVYDLNGRVMSPTGLENGVYIVVTPGGSVKVLIHD